MAAQPAGVSTTPPSLVSSANWLRVHSNSSSRSLMKKLNKTGPSTDPWGTPLVTRVTLGQHAWDTHHTCGTHVALTQEPRRPDAAHASPLRCHRYAGCAGRVSPSGRTRHCPMGDILPSCGACVTLAQDIHDTCCMGHITLMQDMIICTQDVSPLHGTRVTPMGHTLPSCGTCVTFMRHAGHVTLVQGVSLAWDMDHSHMGWVTCAGHT